MGVDADTPLILMVGRITPWKGHELLLRALALLPKGLSYKVAFVGNTNNNLHADKMLALARELGLLGHVVFLGTRDDVPALMAAADMALSCSTRPEAFGRVAIEAMAMGVPVIATALGGSLETVKDGETGWLVQPASNTSSALTFEGFEPQALTEKIAEALRSPSRLVTMGQEARKHVLAHFTVEKCCQAEFEAYLKLGPTPKGKKQGNKK
jgi:glycosyltransferase involved in cell wall biosynthesis